MVESFDAVVVGSGFGGSVSTLRLAAAGRSVCLLERGAKHPPGSFARTPRDLAVNMWDPSERLLGLFDVWSFRHLDAVVASGLGGGSLIYSNVLKRMERTHVPDWVIDPATLTTEYCTVETMLGAAPYPMGNQAYLPTPRATALTDAATGLGLAVEFPNLAVSFGDQPGQPIPGFNLHGASRQTCQRVSECNLGCNYGSKNTMDLTYLSQAMTCPTPPDIRVLSEVKTLRRQPDGTWMVGYVVHDPAASGTTVGARELHFVQTKIVVLSAGTLGTNYLLLTNQSAVPEISDQLGQRFSTNGDFLALLTSKDDQDFAGSSGTVITTSVSGPPTSARPFVVQDGGFPGFADWLVAAVRPQRAAGRAATIMARRIAQRLAGKPDPGRISAQLSSLLAAANRSAGILPLSGTGFDTPSGRLRLVAGLLDNTWRIDESAPFYDGLLDTLHELAATMNARYHQSVSYSLSRAVTVHPLGGCAVGTSRKNGVVNDHGQVFGYENLFVADGSVMPGPVGVNPSLTIAALAERFAPTMIAMSA